MKKVILFAVCTAFSTANFAQMSIGFRGGVNFATAEYSPKSTTTSSNGTSTSETSIVGLSLAIPLEIKISEMFAIQPELAYIQKGYGQQFSSTGSSSSASYNGTSVLTFDYLEIPVSAKVFFGGDNFKFNVLVGPSIGFMLGAKSKSEYTTAAFNGNSAQSSKTETTIDLSDANYKTINKTDFGMHLGAGASLAAGPGRVFLDARYQFGFSDVANDSPDTTKWFNRGLGVSIGYLYQLGDK